MLRTSETYCKKNSEKPSVKAGFSLSSLTTVERVRLAKAKAKSLLMKAGSVESVSNHRGFVSKMEALLTEKQQLNKTSLETLGRSFGITDPNDVKELTELAIVLCSRRIALQSESLNVRFNKLVELYHNQVNLSHRTSQSILLQQYSTPAPISFLAGIYTKGEQRHPQVFEPSAGNGLLTIAFNPETVIVNEIDTLRNHNLRTQPFKEVRQSDAVHPFPDLYHRMDAVITNPPFGTLDTGVEIDGFEIKTLEHMMAIRALDTLKDSGRASIIIGGHMTYDPKGRITAGKNRIFFNYLYSHYHVDDVINIRGKELYSRQGTAFNTRLILISGRKRTVSGSAPLINPSLNTPVKSFQQLYDRVLSAMTGGLNGLYSHAFYSHKI